jgi:hypothetical protein
MIEQLKLKKSIRILKWILALWFIGKIGGCVLAVPGFWGPEVIGVLPNGHKIIFQSRPIGRETDDRLIWIDAEGYRRDYWVDQIHAGFSYVVIKSKDDENGVWIESDGKVGASLDLLTNDFREEQSKQLEWARYGEGNKIAEGRTWSFINIILPW